MFGCIYEKSISIGHMLSHSFTIGIYVHASHESSSNCSMCVSHCSKTGMFGLQQWLPPLKCWVWSFKEMQTAADTSCVEQVLSPFGAASLKRGFNSYWECSKVCVGISKELYTH